MLRQMTLNEESLTSQPAGLFHLGLCKKQGFGSFPISIALEKGSPSVFTRVDDVLCILEDYDDTWLGISRKGGMHCG